MDKLAKCENVSELLALYHYGELTDTKARMVEAHLADCEKCARELEELRRVLGLVPSGMPGQAESARAKAGVMRRIGEARPGPLRRFAPAFAAAALAAVAVIVFNYAGLFTSTAPPPVSVQRNASVDVELLENYEMLSNLDMLEDMDTIENMEEL